MSGFASKATVIIGRTTNGVIIVVIVKKNLFRPKKSLTPIKWLNRALKGEKSIPNIDLKKTMIVKPIAKIATWLGPINFPIAAGSNS